MDAQDDRFDWIDLLQGIKDGEVVPVVGRELLVVPGEDGRPSTLDHELARRLAVALEVPVTGAGADLAQPLELGDVAFAFLRRFPQERERIHSRLRSILDELDPPVPAPLRQLAEIAPFSLFVSTTFDDLLARAVDDARGGEALRLSFSPWKSTRAARDEPADWASAQRPVVYRVMGEPRTWADYAVTDAEILEFVHELQKSPPRALFDAIAGRQLLFLGCGFHDWLARFFIRAMKNQRLSVDAGSRASIVDERVRSEERLVVFLKHFRTEVYRAGSAVEFVARLHEKWQAKQARRAPARAESPSAPALVPAPMPQGGVFLSYSHGDRDPVRKVKEALEAVGIETWFDERDIPAGEDWNALIEENVQRCALFLPFLSRGAAARKEGYFRYEWTLALERAKRIDERVPFILPVALDDTPEGADGVPRGFSRWQWERVAGEPPDTLARVVRRLVRQLRAPQFNP